MQLRNNNKNLEACKSDPILHLLFHVALIVLSCTYFIVLVVQQQPPALHKAYSALRRLSRKWLGSEALCDYLLYSLGIIIVLTFVVKLLRNRNKISRYYKKSREYDL